MASFQYFLLLFIDYKCFANEWDTKLREFLNVTVKIQFIWYPASFVGSNVLGLPLGLKNDLEFTKVT